MRISMGVFRFVALLSGIVFVHSARGGMIQGVHGLNNLGTFEASISYAATSLDPTRAVLRIELHNTTPSQRGGYLTAFAWNNPRQRITGIEQFETTDGDFHMLGLPSLNNHVTAAPFGKFDMAASTGQNWEGGANPNRGLAPGGSATFTVHLFGQNLFELDDASFLSELSAPPHDGRGHHAYAARFRGFDGCGPDSDKVPNDPSPPPPIHHFPEPSSFVLVALGLAGIAGFVGWRRFIGRSNGA